MRELLVGLNEAVHRGRQLGVGVVRAALDLTNSSNTVFSVVASAARASKYSLKSVSNLVGTFAWSSLILGACISTPWATPNWSWPPMVFFLTLAFRSAALYIFFQSGQYFSFLGRSSHISSAQEKLSFESMVFVAMKRRVSSVMGFPALLEHLCASSSALMYLGMPSVYWC